MKRYIWCEDAGSGYQFWKVLFKNLYPDIIVETKHNNSQLSKNAENINEDGNLYYIMIDTATDNPDVLRELKRLKKNISGKNNVRIIELRSFEFALLSFEYLEEWVFAEHDELKDKRKQQIIAKQTFVKLMISGGKIDELKAFKSIYNYRSNTNSEKIAARLLFDITRNTGFETDKSKIGPCFVCSCCEWDGKQDDDICGLDNSKPTLSEKMKQLFEYSVLHKAFEEAGL